MGSNWVQAWGQAHSALSFFYYPSCKKTFRLVMNTAVSGEKLRVVFSNKCGKNDVVVGAVTASPCDSEGNYDCDEYAVLTVGGATGFTLKKGENVASDETDFRVGIGGYFCISVYVERGDLTSGNLLSNVNLITAKGNRTAERCLSNEPRTRDSVRKVACQVLGMFLHKPIPLFESVELFNSENARSIVVFGDSLSQQGFWTNAFDKRIRDAYPGRYSVINKSIMGNRILRDYSPRFICKGLFGESGLSRIKDDIYPFPDVEYVIFNLGINDFLQYGTITTPKSEKPDPDELCAAVNRLTLELQAHGIKVVMLTYIGFGACADYRDEKEVLRKQVNTWLRENKNLFDAFYDQDEVCRDPQKDNFTRLEYLGADKLHPNEAGGQLIADSLDIGIFAQKQDESFA
ncbi:MAG: hypothetical protein GX851_08280 [Clostridiales bacterium]|nr:hypothetical protein [Clostridiales bacterium]